MKSSLPFRLTASLAAVVILSSGLARAQDASMSMSGADIPPEHLEFFESKIRPVLIKHCYKCHSTESEKIKGGLLLDSREAALRGGDSGPAIVPGEPIDSLLFTAITYEDSSLEMPPKIKLSADVVADFEKWIHLGAPDPRKEKRGKNKPVEKYTSTVDIEKGKEHWAYRHPQKHSPPKVSHPDWPRNEIDQFILARLDAEGLTPAPDADPRTLLRRLSFDIIGLPPSPQQSEKFVKAYAEDPEAALKYTVDKLLESPQFGERWGRHWMDVARYAESSGKESNITFPHAWRYRDYVIDSFNKDKAFDRFITEQIAGDLLPFESDEERAEHLVATGFLAIGTKSLNEQNTRQFRFDLIDEQIDTTTRAFLGTTVACARCHDHKFDPIPQSDYYAMAGIFLSSDTFFGTARTQQNRRATDLLTLPVPDSELPVPALTLREQIGMDYALHQQREQLQETFQKASEARRDGNADEAQRLGLSTIRMRNTIGLLEARIGRYGDEGQPLTLAMGVGDREEPFDSQLLIRGEEDNATSERIPRGYVQVIQTHDEEPIPKNRSGRLELAHWITSPENPLTSRVMTNRVWHWLFGQGLVPTVDNFGATGQTPSHPELFDHLAIRFYEMNWSVKDLIREVALSRTYRMGSRFNEAHFNKDPENRLLWRMSPRRLDAESIRDAVLAVSGQLDLDRPLGSVVALAGDGAIGRSLPEARLTAETKNRSVYLPIVRDLVPDSLDLFDFADPSLMTGRREVTTVPSQALYLMNSDFVLENSEAMARYLIEDLKLTREKLGYTAFYLAYSRPPTSEESRKTKAYFERFMKTARDGGATRQEAGYLALSTFCQSLLSSAEFRYIN